MTSKTLIRIRGRWRLAALLAALVGLVALPGTALAGTLRLTPPTGNSNAPGGHTFTGDTGRHDVVSFGWIGPAAEVGQEPGFFVTQVRPPTGPQLTAVPPCYLKPPPPGPIGHLNRAICPVSSGGQTYTTFQINLRGSGSFPNSVGTRGPSQGFPVGQLTGGAIRSLNQHRLSWVDGLPIPIRVIGRGGNDRMTISNIGGSGNFLYGGPGTDLLQAQFNGERDTVTCGTGVNDIARVDLQDIVTDPSRCATIERAPKDQFPTLKVLGRSTRVRGGRAAVRLRCPRQVKGGPCRGRLTIKKGRRTVGARRYRVRKGGTRVVRVRVRRARGPVRVIATDRGSDRRPKTTTVRLRLRG